MNFCYLISSHVGYVGPLKRILKSMEYISGTRKLVSVGGYNGNSHVRVDFDNDGPSIMYSNHNSFDYTALIDWLDTIARYTDATHVFLLHDTMELRPQTDDLISHADTTMDATAAFDGGQCNLCLFRTDWLMQNRDRILAMRNCTKEQAVAFEGVLWKDAPRRALFDDARCEVLSEKVVYAGGLKRRTELYTSVQILKYKASWGQEMETIGQRVKP